MTGEAIAFESKMADVAKVVNFESPAELENMSRVIQDLSLQIPIAAEGFADITTAAAQSGVAKDKLVEFSIQAAKMGVTFDIAAGEASKTMADWQAGMALTLEETYSLADAVNHLANNMNATAPEIAQILNRMGAVGKAASFTEKQLAALAATGLSSGANAEVVGTGLNSIFSVLTQGSSMSKEAASAFQALGFDAQTLAKNMQMDAQGTIFSVLEAISALPKENQLSVITAAFGQMSLKSIAPMVGNLDNLRAAFGMVGDAAIYAGSMEAEYAARSATTENSLQLMKNSFNVLCITIGSLFLPVVDKAAKAVSFMVRGLVAFSRSPAGAFLIKLAAGIAASLLGVTGLITAFAVLKPVLLIAAGALSTVFWPVTLIAGAAAALALAWKSDFMGIASTAAAFASKVKLVFHGVLEIFGTLKDGRGQLSAELAKKIEAAGLMGLVTTVSRVIYRVLGFFKKLAAGVTSVVGPAFSRLGQAFRLVTNLIKPLFGHLGHLGQSLARAAGQTDAAPWQVWGQVIGELAGGTLAWFIDVIGVAVLSLGSVIEAIQTVCGWLSSLGGLFGDVLFNVVSFVDGTIAKISALAPAVIARVTAIVDGLRNFNLMEASLGLIDGFISGIQAGAANLVNAVTGVLSRVRALLPFSDAQAGPLSNLTASGMAFISTFAAGIMAKAESLVSAVSGILGRVRSLLPFSDAKMGPLSNLTASGQAIPGTLALGVRSGTPRLVSAAENMFSGLNLAPPYFESPELAFRPQAPAGRLPEPSFSTQEGHQGASPFRHGQAPGSQGRNINLHIGRIELPNVQDADGFIAALEAIVEERV